MTNQTKQFLEYAAVAVARAAESMNSEGSAYADAYDELLAAHRGILWAADEAKQAAACA